MRKPVIFIDNDNDKSGSKKTISMKEKEIRAPTVPLITSDPYFGVWSANNKLYEGIE